MSVNAQSFGSSTMSSEDKSKTQPMEPKRKRPRRPLIDAASVSERVVLNVEDGSAGLRREYPLVDAAKALDKGEKKGPEEEKAEPEKTGSVKSVSDSEDGVTEVPDHMEEPDPEKELLKAAGQE